MSNLINFSFAATKHLSMMHLMIAGQGVLTPTMENMEAGF